MERWLKFIISCACKWFGKSKRKKERIITVLILLNIFLIKTLIYKFITTVLKVLFLFTDGIPEAMNESEEEYSDERMEEFFLQNKTKTAQEFVDKIVEDVKTFTGNAEQSDDITVLYLIKKTDH